MLQTHPLEARTAKSKCPAASTGVLDYDANTIAWLLMGDVRSLLQNDVEDAETADWLRTSLASLVPVLQRIQESQFETGPLSNLLHTNSDCPNRLEKRFSEFRCLTDTLDELLIRIEWNLPVSDLVPFADLRLAHWITEVRSVTGRDLR